MKGLGWALIIVGSAVVLLSPWIVFPGFELTLGIETLVGPENVVYLEEGGYMYTNPGAMVNWIAAVACAGLLLASAGAALLWRGTGTRRQA